MYLFKEFSAITSAGEVALISCAKVSPDGKEKDRKDNTHPFELSSISFGETGFAVSLGSHKCSTR